MGPEVITVATLEQARAAKQALREALAGADGITGVGLEPAETPHDDAPDAWCVLVNVVRADAVEVPSDVDGVPVRVRVTGTIEAL